MIQPEGRVMISEVTGAVATGLRLEQTSEHFLVGHGGSDVDSTGSVLWADPSEGNVKWFDSNGQLKRVLGRKGSGPGEFRNPYYPRFGPDGSIHVVDLGSSGAITIFDAAGTYRHRTGPPGVTSIGGLAVLPDGGYLVAAHSPDSNKLEVLHLLRSDGSLVRSLLPIRNVIPDGTEPDPLWDHMRRFFLAFDHPNVYVTAALSDSLWTVDLVAGTQTAWQIKFEQRAPISLPPEGSVQDVAGLVQWAGQYRFATDPVVAGNLVILSFMRGRLLDDLDVVQLVRDDRGSWWQSADSVVVLGGSRNRLVGVYGHADSLRLIQFHITANHQ